MLQFCFPEKQAPRRLNRTFIPKEDDSFIEKVNMVLKETVSSDPKQCWVLQAAYNMYILSDNTQGIK